MYHLVFVVYVGSTGVAVMFLSLERRDHTLSEAPDKGSRGETQCTIEFSWCMCGFDGRCVLFLAVDLLALHSRRLDFYLTAFDLILCGAFGLYVCFASRLLCGPVLSRGGWPFSRVVVDSFVSAGEGRDSSIWSLGEGRCFFVCYASRLICTLLVLASVCFASRLLCGPVLVSWTLSSSGGFVFLSASHRALCAPNIGGTGA